MNLNGDEKRIQQLFREMSRDDQRRAPQFDSVLEMVRESVRKFPDHPDEWTWAMLLAAHPQEAKGVAETLLKNADIALYEAHHGRVPDGAAHLRAAGPQHFPAHCHQARQGEFQAQREYQEYHAEVRQQLGGLAAVRQVECVRTQHHPHREIAENGRQFQSAHTRHHANGSGEQNQDLQ
jgi:hypothetical protein